MKTYAIASLVGTLAFTFIVLGAGPDSGPAVAQARARAWPATDAPMARRDTSPWLLRAMKVPSFAGTLENLPGDEPAAARSL